MVSFGKKSKIKKLEIWIKVLVMLLQLYPELKTPQWTVEARIRGRDGKNKIPHEEFGILLDLVSKED